MRHYFLDCLFLVFQLQYGPKRARFRQCRDLVRECEMFVEYYEAKVTSRVSDGVKMRRVMSSS